MQFNIGFYRKAIQCFFLATTLLIGIKFFIFVQQLESGRLPTVVRPPGVEAFLPISSLISLKYWLVTGIFNQIHPSGMIILLMVLSTAVLMKRGFCSWVCPFGLLTEYLNRIHATIFNRKIKIPRWIDYPLRSLKYLLLAFFLWAIVFKMDAAALEYFIYSPYNMVADLKMLYFFVNITAFVFWVLAALVVLSILIRNFWCRYLCPYGALEGVLSFLSILKIRRNEIACTGCQQCTRICPADITVHQTSCVISDECHACLKCVSVCPENDAIYISASKQTGKIKPWIYAVAICMLFLGGPAIGRLTGYWQNSISANEYIFHARHIGLPIYQHNRGKIPSYDKNAWLRMIDQLKKTEDRLAKRVAIP